MSGKVVCIHFELFSLLPILGYEEIFIYQPLCTVIAKAYSFLGVNTHLKTSFEERPQLRHNSSSPVGKLICKGTDLGRKTGKCESIAGCYPAAECRSSSTLRYQFVPVCTSIAFSLSESHRLLKYFQHFETYHYSDRK